MQRCTPKYDSTILTLYLNGLHYLLHVRPDAVAVEREENAVASAPLYLPRELVRILPRCGDVTVSR